MTKKTHFGVHDSKGSAETLVRRGGITNNHLIEYSFSNISAKNYQNRLMFIEVIVCNVIVVFFETQYIVYCRQRVSKQRLERRPCLQVGPVNRRRRTSSSSWFSDRIADNTDLVDELMLRKNGQARNICTLYLIIWPYCLQKITILRWWASKI